MEKEICCLTNRHSGHAPIFGLPVLLERRERDLLVPDVPRQVVALQVPPGAEPDDDQVHVTGLRSLDQPVNHGVFVGVLAGFKGVPLDNRGQRVQPLPFPLVKLVSVIRHIRWVSHDLFQCFSVKDQTRLPAHHDVSSVHPRRRTIGSWVGREGRLVYLVNRQKFHGVGIQCSLLVQRDLHVAIGSGGEVVIAQAVPSRVPIASVSLQRRGLTLCWISIVTLPPAPKTMCQR